jgi:diguanylate cyclase (GGDEF)-like protein/PAS domain S-box-containing protein
MEAGAARAKSDLFMTARALPSPSLFSRLKLFAPAGAQLSTAQSAALRGAQLQAIVTLTPYMFCANVVSVLIFDALFWGGARRGFLIIWTALMGAHLAAWALRWRRSRSRGAQTSPVARALWRASFRGFAFALLWATPLVILFGDATAAQRIVLIATAGGMMAGGAMALATVWQASLTYAVTLAAPLMGVLLAAHEPMLWGLAALAGSFAFAIARAVLDRAPLRLRDQSQVISLLLKDFEENASNWLFEVDASMRLTRVSERCAQMFGREPNQLEGQDVLSLIASPQYGSVRGGAMQQLYRAFRRQEAFRDVLLPISVGGERRWWSLTGRPIVDGSGAFRGFRGVGSDVTETMRGEDSAGRMANFDTVTGLPNRNYMNHRLAAAAQCSASTGARFALISLDLDPHRPSNGASGHRIDDRLLRAVADRIRGALEDCDTVARFPGGAFVILQDKLPQSAEIAAATLAQKLVARIGLPYEIDGQRVVAAPSLGIAIAPRDGESAGELLRNADLALYRAKADGKARYQFFKPEMDAEMQARRHLELDLRDALERGELTVNFQPLVETSTGAIKACEALVRWTHPTLGAIAPADFLPIAEETGLIMPLGEFVLRTACVEAASWSRIVSVAVNLSVAQFRGGDLPSLVKRVLEETGLPPERLDLEITQSMLIEDRETVLATLGKLRAQGVRISLDDFGAGYSSLDYLSSFPFDKIKIDRTFVHDVAQRPDSAAIIGAITDRAATLGICTTAEGVETIEELDWLRAHGCGEAQGYLFSAAVPAEAFRVLLGMRSQPRPKPSDKNAAA